LLLAGVGDDVVDGSNMMRGIKRARSAGAIVIDNPDLECTAVGAFASKNPDTVQLWVLPSWPCHLTSGSQNGIGLVILQDISELVPENWTGG
jgi:hypothetical protein